MFVDVIDREQPLILLMAHSTHVKLIIRQRIVDAIARLILGLRESYSIQATSDDSCVAQRQVRLVQTLLEELVWVLRDHWMAMSGSSTWFRASQIGRELLVESLKIGGHLLRLLLWSHTNLAHMWQIDRVEMLVMELLLLNRDHRLLCALALAHVYLIEIIQILLVKLV